MDTVSNIDKISGNIADVLNNRIFSGTLEIINGIIVNITEDKEKYENYIIPGLIDSHIHIESSMLIPSEFARIAPVHGTVAVVADPHEIANVLGVDGIKFMIENGKSVPFKFYFEAPSCVPATAFETSGANIDADQIEELLKEPEIIALGEMMNVPGVLSDDPQVMGKIEAAKKYGKPIDGHAPDLRGDNLKKYINAGISTDHECYEKEEAMEKIKLGMKILIREGSAAKDFDALSSLIEEYPDFCMFASDDKHPNDLVKGHINLMVKKALELGYDKMKVLQCACVNPVKHYKLDTGLLQKGDKADFIVIDSFENFNILKTVIYGKIVSENGWSLIPKVKTTFINNFQAELKKPEDFIIKYTGKKINIIEALNGLLVTNRLIIAPKVSDNHIISDTDRDILKIAVINRYKDSTPSVALVKNFGFKKGAIASSVAHDSHNIIAVGVSDEDLANAVNLVIKNKGGLSVVHEDFEMSLPLPVAGLMTDIGAYKVAENYTNIEKEAKKLGSNLDDPFMTLSFMALLVIPDLKISDKGLFDVNKFKFIGIDEP
ncbi:MAG: adenine deaminase [Candidatus Gastranaerophilales bacterium]|nr:adenine deaminase [Candidatus Gastranaerophilales bacterium]